VTPLQTETPLPDIISGLLGLDGFGFAGEFVAALLAAFLIGNLMMAMTGVAGPWAKRKITAAFTDRIAVNRIGPFGLFIIVADAVRLLAKELIVPEGVDRPAWDLAPLVVAGSAMLGFAVIPMGNGIHLADPDVGLAYVFAVSSIASLGLVMAGYASNNKYSMLCAACGRTEPGLRDSAGDHRRLGGAVHRLAPDERNRRRPAGDAGQRRRAGDSVVVRDRQPVRVRPLHGV